jgi:YceI-like domain
LRKGLNAAALALLLAACGAPPPRPPNPHPAAPPPTAAHGAAYRIDSAHSELRLLVYRAGALAALGHDHVIVNRALEGWVSPAGSAAGAAFFLSIPTSGFMVDEAAARAQEGADFSAEVGDDARAGTLHNMLSPALLDAQNHAAITVESISIEPAPGGAQVPPADGQVAPAGMQATLRISVAGHESSLVLPFTVQTSAGRLHVQTAFTVQQTALGLTPFTALLGALRVEDQLRVKLDLVAVRD